MEESGQLELFAGQSLQTNPAKDESARRRRGGVVFHGNFNGRERSLIDHYMSGTKYGYEDGQMPCRGNVVSMSVSTIPSSRMVDIGDELSVIKVSHVRTGDLSSEQEFARCVLMARNWFSEEGSNFNKCVVKKASAKAVLDKARKAKKVALDIETTGLDPNAGRVVSVCVVPMSGKPVAYACVNKDDEKELVGLLDKLAVFKVGVVACGAVFEQKWCFAKTGKTLNLIGDVQVDAALVSESGHKGLEFLACSVGWAGYEVEMQDWTEPLTVQGSRIKQRGVLVSRDIWTAPEDLLARYNAMDTVVTRLTYERSTELVEAEPSRNVMRCRDWLLRGQTCLGVTEQTGMAVCPVAFVRENAELATRMRESEKMLGDEMRAAGMPEDAKVLNPENKLKLLHHYGVQCDTTGKEELGHILKSRRLSQDQDRIMRLLLKHSSDSSIMSNVMKAVEDAVARDKRVRTSFSLTKLLTGQISSVDPPMMNVAKSPVRRVFVSRFPGGSILDLDYSQLHMRIIGNAAGCKGFITAYRDGVDLHTRTAAGVVMSIPEDAFIKRYEAKDPECAKARDLGKRLNFSVIFEITAEGLAARTGLDIRYCDQVIRQFFHMYPEIKDAILAQHDHASEHGYVVSVTGRVRHLPDAMLEATAGSRWELRMAREKALRQSGDYLVSNPGRSITLYGMTMMQELLLKRRMRSRVVLQMHDNIVHDMHPDEVEDVLKMAKECYIDRIHEEFPTITNPIPLEMDGYVNSCWWKDGNERKVKIK